MSNRVGQYYGPRHAGYKAPRVDRVNLMALIRRSLRMFRSRWWIAFVTLIIGTGVAVYQSMTTPDTYRASSKLSIAPRVSFSQRSSDRAIVMEEKSNFTENQLVYMQSSQLLGRVEERMHEFREGGAPPKRLTVSQGQGSTFVLSVESPDLEYARQFARTWAQEFRAFKEQLLSDVANKQLLKTRMELSSQEQAVTEAQARLDAFVRGNNIATSQDTVKGAAELLQTLQRRKQNLDLERNKLESMSAEELADARSAAIEAAGGGANANPAPSTPTMATATAIVDTGLGVPAPADSVDPLDKFIGKSSYRELKLRLAGYRAEVQRRTELKPLHPWIIKINEGIVETEREIGAQLAMIEEQRQARIRSLKQESDVLDRQIQERRKEVERLGGINREFLALEEDLKSKKAQLNQTSRDLAALTQIPSNEEYFAILEEGVASDRPIAPKRSRIIIMGVTIGLLSGIGLIFLLHRLDDRVDSAEDLEKSLDEPILGQIPMISRRDLRGRSLVSVDALEPNNLFVEAFRGVRSSVMFGDLGGRKQVLMGTSSVPGDGKSTFTVNFAITLAKAGNRVLLIDGDLRRGSLAEVFGIPAEPGLSEVLGGLENWTDVLNATAHRTLLVITAGKSVTNPGELLLSKTMKRMIEEARREFDYILFDCPPVIGMDDAPTLATHCDGIIFVYRVGVTSLKLAKLAVNTLHQRGGNILGLILNGVSITNPDYYYTAYYYSHYTYDQRPRSLPEGEEAEVHRPEGARLLAAMKEGETGAESSPGAVLLAGESNGADGNKPPKVPPDKKRS